jgi:hypothetical protein
MIIAGIFPACYLAGKKCHNVSALRVKLTQELQIAENGFVFVTHWL